MTNILFPVVHAGGPESGQGVFRNKDADIGTVGPDAMVMLLGYLAAIFVKVCHSSYPEEIRRLPGITGSGTFDCAAEFKNFQVTHAVIQVTDYPAGADLVFCEPPEIYAGRCGFFVSGGSRHAFDWGIVVPQKSNISFEAYAGFNAPPQTVPWGNQETTGSETTLINGVHKNPIDNLNLTGGTAVFIEFQGTLGSSGKQAKQAAPLVLPGQVSIFQKAFYPIKWVNHEQSIYRADDVMANGFWWDFKLGVTADITIYGTEIEPGVSITGGESGAVEFNPMKGGFQQ